MADAREPATRINVPFKRTRDMHAEEFRLLARRVTRVTRVPLVARRVTAAGVFRDWISPTGTIIRRLRVSRIGHRSFLFSFRIFPWFISYPIDSRNLFFRIFSGFSGRRSEERNGKNKTRKIQTICNNVRVRFGLGQNLESSDSLCE